MADKLTLFIISLKSLAIVSRLMGGIMIGVTLLFLLPFVVPYLDGAKEHDYIRSALSMEHTIGLTVKMNFPTRIAGKDMTRWILIIAALLVNRFFNTLSRRWDGQAQFFQEKAKVDEWRQLVHLSDNSILLTPLNQQLERLKTGEKGDRELVHQEFARTKKRFEEKGRTLAFLAIGVVDSVGLKQGEVREIIARDFSEYKLFVERILGSYGCLKSTWTPYGVMSAFTTIDQALRAAREVIIDLGEFNRQVKSMKRDFSVSCGVNCGFVYFDESFHLEGVHDRVINIASQIQKQTAANTIGVAKSAISQLEKHSGFQPSGTKVEGDEVYEWKKS